jgi:uncharacterized protein YacL
MRALISIAYVVLGGVVGGCLVWVLQGHTLSLSPAGMTFADLSAVLLTAVSLIVALIGTAIALVALWGFTQFRKIVEDRTHAAVLEMTPALLVSELRVGEPRKVLVNLVAEFFANEEQQPGVARAWNEERQEKLAVLDEIDKDAE